MKRERRGGAASDSDRVSAFGVAIDPSQDSQRERVRSSGEFLRRFEWSHIATLTFERPKHPEQVMKDFRVFVNDLEQRSQARVDWVAVIEDTRRGEAHIHALLNLRNDLACVEIGSAWEGSRRKRGQDRSIRWPSGEPSVAKRSRKRGTPDFVRSKPRGSVLDEDVLTFRTELLMWERIQKAKGRRTRHLKYRKLRRRKRGRQEIEVYDPDKGWAFYIMKRVDGDLVHWDPSGLPRGHQRAQVA